MTQEGTVRLCIYFVRRWEFRFCLKPQPQPEPEPLEIGEVNMEAKTSGMGHILPGTILYLPPCSIIPKQSIIYRNRGQVSFKAGIAEYRR